MKKNIGIRDTEGKHYRDTVYCKKIYWDIQRERSSQDFLTFQLTKIILKTK